LPGNLPSRRCPGIEALPSAPACDARATAAAIHRSRQTYLRAEDIIAIRPLLHYDAVGSMAALRRSAVRSLVTFRRQGFRKHDDAVESRGKVAKRERGIVQPRKLIVVQDLIGSRELGHLPDVAFWNEHILLAVCKSPVLLSASISFQYCAVQSRDEMHR